MVGMVNFDDVLFQEEHLSIGFLIQIDLGNCAVHLRVHTMTVLFSSTITIKKLQEFPPRIQHLFSNWSSVLLRSNALAQPTISER